MFKLKLHWQILIALALAVLAGWLGDKDAAVFGLSALAVYEFLSSLFLSVLKMLIVPLVMSSIICDIAGVGRIGALGRLGAKLLRITSRPRYGPVCCW